MKNLLNFIFDNLIPIIIVVSVVIRIFAGIKKSASREKAAPPVPVVRQDDEEVDVWSRLRPDPDDEEEEEYPASLPSTAGPAVPAPFQTIRPLLMPAPSLGGPPPAPPANPDPGIARPFAPVTTGIEPIAAAPDNAEPGLTARPPGQAASRRGPLDRLNSLPPLRRAVVLAEILGAPKGLN
jgi:hypothetical protein